MVIDIEDYHVNEKEVVKDIHGIIIDETPYSTITSQTKNFFIIMFNEKVREDTGQLIPFGDECFTFEWDVEGTDVYKSVDEQFTMQVNSNNEELLSGSDEYTFQLTDDNINHNIGSQKNLFIFLGLLLFIIIFIGIISVVIKKIFSKGG